MSQSEMKQQHLIEILQNANILRQLQHSAEKLTPKMVCWCYQYRHNSHHPYTVVGGCHRVGFLAQTMVDRHLLPQLSSKKHSCMTKHFVSHVWHGKQQSSDCKCDTQKNLLTADFQYIWAQSYRASSDHFYNMLKINNHFGGMLKQHHFAVWKKHITFTRWWVSCI